MINLTLNVTGLKILIRATNTLLPRNQGRRHQIFVDGLQMFERETKREKILEARQREIRLKERSRSEQSKEDETVRDEGEDAAEQLIARAESDFYSLVEVEFRRRQQREEAPQVRS